MIGLWHLKLELDVGTIIESTDWFTPAATSDWRFGTAGPRSPILTPASRAAD